MENKGIEVAGEGDARDAARLVRWRKNVARQFGLERAWARWGRRRAREAVVALVREMGEPALLGVVMAAVVFAAGSLSVRVATLPACVPAAAAAPAGPGSDIERVLQERYGGASCDLAVVVADNAGALAAGVRSDLSRGVASVRPLGVSAGIGLFIAFASLGVALQTVWGAIRLALRVVVYGPAWWAAGAGGAALGAAWGRRASRRMQRFLRFG